MSNNLVWATAQANETNSNSLLTNGAFTATQLLEVHSAGGTGNNTFTLPAPWVQFVQSNKLVLVFSATEAILPDTNSAAGYRILITNASLLPALTFYTNATAPAVPPVATTQPATSVTASAATLNGLVTPGSATTDYYFQFGTTTNHGSFTATNSLAAGTNGIAVSAALSGLATGTEYHFRLVASSGAGTSIGEDAGFTTLTVTPPTLGSLVFSTNTSFGFSFTNVPGGSFTTLASTSVMLPITNWTVLGPLVEFPPGFYSFTNLPVTNTMQFYRVRSP
jgi:hypothetical protein